MKILKTFIRAAAAGLCIALGGTAFLCIDNKIVGALFFTLGLFVIVNNGFDLFTGKVCYLFDNPPSYILSCVVIWLGNFAGTFLSSQLILQTRIGQAVCAKAQALCDVKLSDSILSVFILAVFCNMMIFIAVDGFKNNPHHIGKYLSLFLGVAAFILCSYEHCIANMFYFSAAGAWSIRALGYLGIMTLGNTLGGLVLPLLKKAVNK